MVVYLGSACSGAEKGSDSRQGVLFRFLVGEDCRTIENDTIS
jgi:hypothetical protein